MGIKRMIWRSTAIDTISNIADEGSIVEGIKRTTKEDIYEDNPITYSIYRAGQGDGKKEGYDEASNEYEQKLLDLADKYLKQTKIFKEERKQYEELLDAYENEIKELSEKVDRTEAENYYLNQLLIREQRLKRMYS